jgi:bifunctional non-homologous end joining protein LigD
MLLGAERPLILAGGGVIVAEATEELRALAERMAPLRRDTSPFDVGSPRARDTTWVEPELVAQIAFTEWTRDGSLRHPRYLGLRDDKPAREVVRERPPA